MPIQSEIIDSLKLVIARVTGTMTGQDMEDYQMEVWAKESVSGYDEIVDVTGVEKFDYKSSDSMKAVAHLSAQMDWINHSKKLAIVAADDTAVGLARMYQSHRENEKVGKKEVRVFKSMEQARQWLGR